MCVVGYNYASNYLYLNVEWFEADISCLTEFVTIRVCTMRYFQVFRKVNDAKCFPTNMV